MSPTEIRIVWLASALFFGFGQIVVVVISSLSPRHIDDAVDYLEWMLNPIKYILGISFLALLFAIVMTWIYGILSDKSSIGYIVSVIVTLLGLGVFAFGLEIIKQLITSRLRKPMDNQ